jgi:glycosyltransferase involved in cell wall biosynthesis
MGQKIAMLLNNPISNDYRVIKMIQSISKKAEIDLFYMDGNEQIDKSLFNDDVKLFSFDQTNSLKRKILKHSFFCYEFNFFIKAVLSNKIQYDFIWCNDLPTLNAGYKISKKLNAKLVYDSHEIFVETINQFFPIKSNGVKQLIFKFIILLMKSHGRRIEGRILPKVNSFITVNESILNYFKEKYAINKGVVVMNLPRISDSNSSKDVIDFHKMYNWEKSDIIILYQGVINHGRGLELLIDSFIKLPNNYKLVIIGNGPLLNLLIQKTNKLEADESIKFIDTVKLSELSKYTKAANLGVNLLEAYNLSKKLASPNKLFEYIHAGLPVIASDTIENTIVLNKFNVGIITPNNSDSIKQKILNITDKDLAYFTNNTIIASEYYNWENQENKILNLIK